MVAVLRTASPFLSHVLHHDVHWTRLSNLVIRCERKKRSFPLCCGVAPSHLPAPFVQCWCAVWDGGRAKKTLIFVTRGRRWGTNIDLGGRGAAARHTPTHHSEERFFRSHWNRILLKWWVALELPKRVVTTAVEAIPKRAKASVAANGGCIARD